MKLLLNNSTIHTVEYNGHHHPVNEGISEWPDDFADFAQYKFGHLGMVIFHGKIIEESLVETGSEAPPESSSEPELHTLEHSLSIPPVVKRRSTRKSG